MRSATAINSGKMFMAREYPRFIFSNPKNTKSEGPFLVHTLDPYIIFKVHRKNKAYHLQREFHSQPERFFESEDIALECLNVKEFPSNTHSQINSIAEAGMKWLKAQLINKEIVF